jgi:hypothetical protein
MGRARVSQFCVIAVGGKFCGGMGRFGSLTGRRVGGEIDILLRYRIRASEPEQEVTSAGNHAEVDPGMG